MRKKCPYEGCHAPKGLCKVSTSPQHQSCPHWLGIESEPKSTKKSTKSKSTIIPWSGLALQPEDIELLSHRSSPKIIGIIGAANAGKSSYLGMLYTLLYNGKKFKNWNFAGSFSLVAWENLAKHLKIKPNGKVDFPPTTPSAPDFYSLFHLALRNEDQFQDILFADSSGEVFTKWASKVDDINAENARWIYQHAQAFIFFIDSEAIIRERGRAKLKIIQLAGQVAANLGQRPVTIVWSKADKIKEVRPNIKEAIDKAMVRLFPHALTLKISNYSKEDTDTLCHVNNLRVTEYLINEMCKTQSLQIIPDRGETTDFFFKYKGSYENQ